MGIGRLRSDVTLAQARDNMATVQAQLAKDYPESDDKIGVELVALKDTAVADVRGSLWFLFGAVCVLLLMRKATPFGRQSAVGASRLN